MNPPAPPPPATPPGQAPAAPAGGPAADTSVSRRRWRFLRHFGRALVDRQTYDLRENPYLLLGALVAVPIPVLEWMSGGPLAIRILSLFAPLGWGLVLGASGRVAARASEALLAEKQRAAAAQVAHVVERTNLQESLESERSQREELEAAQRLITTELKLAQAIQKTLVPADIVRPDLQVVVRNIPSSYVGGDYLQAYMPRPDLLYLCVGDVSGHGVAAALVVNRLHGHVRRLILEQRSPEQFLEELNRAALRIFQHTYFFLTFGVFRVDLSKRRITYATAGHPAQFLLRASGHVECLATPNRLLGMDADIFDSERPVDEVAFGPGDSLVLFTDGLFEIPGAADGEILGEDGLRKTLENLGGLPPVLVAGDILQDLATFQGHSQFEDDVSLVVARFDPTAVSTPPSNAAPAGVGLAPTPALSVSTVTGFSLPTLPPAPPTTTSSAAPSGTVAAPRERAGAAR